MHKILKQRHFVHHLHRKAPAMSKKQPKKPEAFSDSFTTSDASFSVDVKLPVGQSAESIEVKIDCGGSIHGDEDTIDVLIEMLESARQNLVVRRGTGRRTRLEAL